MLDEALLLLPQELGVARKVAIARAASTSASCLRAAVAERVMTPAVDGGLAATAADDGVTATTTTTCLRAAVAERVMATWPAVGWRTRRPSPAFGPRPRSR